MPENGIIDPMKNLLFLITAFVALFTINKLSAQTPVIRLGSESDVTLLTCSPGDELYSVFGHSAIRVKDNTNNLDLVFNYGTFDFSDPNFYTNFVRGRLNYMLSVTEYRYFEESYRVEGRYIIEHKLNISHPEKQYLLDSLIINYQPQNRYYLYDFFFDNCATRIRDIFVESSDRQITFNYSVLNRDQSFRELLMPYLSEKPWARLGINLALGLPADKTADPWEYMFLPDHLMTIFEHAKISSAGGDEYFTKSGELILEGVDRESAKIKFLPFWIFLTLLILAVILSYSNYMTERITWWFDRIIFGITGLLGLLIVFLWFGTDHQVTAWNLNIIWAHPFHLAAVFFFKEKKRTNTFLNSYLLVNSTLLILLILSWPFLPQPLPWMIMPFVLLLLIRSILILKTPRPASVKS